MDEKAGDVTVEGVYDLASDVGKEFEKMIDNWGAEAVSNLMPKVICTLEHLEMLCLRKDEVEAETDRLRTRIYQLEHEKKEKAERREKFESEVELIEENWRSENLQLNEMVAKLKDENSKLTNCLSQRDIETSQSLPDERIWQHQQETMERNHRLNLTVSKKEKEVQLLQKQVDGREADIEKLKDQSENASQHTRDLRRRIKHLQSQTRALIEEKAQLEAQLQDQDRDLAELKQQLGVAAKENIELTTNHLSEKKQQAFIDNIRKPKFSLIELRNILIERNDLRARVNELEDELAHFKKKKTSEKSLSSPSSSTTSSPSPSHSNTSCDDCDDLPVQGPINREPEDKLFPEKKASILRFEDEDLVLFLSPRSFEMERKQRKRRPDTDH